MNASEIAAQLRKDRSSSAKVYLLLGEINRRRIEASARLETITPGIHRNPVLDEAVVAGPVAVAALVSEREVLTAELSYIEDLEDLTSRAYQAAVLAEKKAALPIAVKAFPGKLEAVRRAMQSLDAAIASCNETVFAMGAYHELGEVHPLPDQLLADLLGVRNNLWTPRHLAVLFPDRRGIDEPDEPGDFPLSWPLTFKVEQRQGARMVSQLRPSDMTPRPIG